MGSLFRHHACHLLPAPSLRQAGPRRGGSKGRAATLWGPPSTRRRARPLRRAETHKPGKGDETSQEPGSRNFDHGLQDERGSGPFQMRNSECAMGASSALTPASPPGEGEVEDAPRRYGDRPQPGAARGHYGEPKLMNSERAVEWGNVRLCSLMFAYVRLIREKLSRVLGAAIAGCKMHEMMNRRSRCGTAVNQAEEGKLR